jgi:hypothetical protein
VVFARGKKPLAGSEQYVTLDLILGQLQTLLLLKARNSNSDISLGWSMNFTCI